MYLNMFKKKYPVMSDKFMNEEVLPYIASTHDAEMVSMIVVCLVTGKMNKRNFWILRKKIAMYRDNRMNEYLTSPKSEHYHCS
jgi:flagellar biosynthesis/type III secretory pathway chaperone